MTPAELTRRHLPTALAVLAVVAAALALPSSLNLPQANPSTTLELAPVPPDSKAPPPPNGNFSSLGLAGSSSLNGGPGAPGGGAGAPPPPPPLGAPLSGLGAHPSTKQCVGDPPRQAEDPLSPPCVAYFDGDNGGATYQGVTRSEVRIVLYYDAGTFTDSSYTETTPSNTIIDLDAPPTQNETREVSINRQWERFFNSRYQTYNRHVHFFVQFGSADSSGRTSASSRQADAALAYAQVKPFAALFESNFPSFNTVYTGYMAQHGVLTFGSSGIQEESSYQTYPGLQWGYDAPMETLAKNYAAFVCQRVVGKATDTAGTGFPNGTPRKLGFMETTDPSYPVDIAESELVKRELKRCGAVVADTATYPVNGYTVTSGTTPQFAVNNMARFKQEGITTILWPSGMEVQQSKAASQLSYYPEWLLGQDNVQDRNGIGQVQDQQQWAHASLVTSVVYTPTFTQSICYLEYRTVDTTTSEPDVNLWGCFQYNDLRQLFTGIQVAGPTLGRASVDQGYHAIPDKPSTSIQLPACYYQPGDYTCVKDATVEYWDAQGRAASGNSPGCWRMLSGGRRYNDQKFPPGNVSTGRDAARDLCNNYDGPDLMVS